MPPSPSTPSPERGAIRQTLDFLAPRNAAVKSAVWEMVERARSELAALEAAVVAIRTQLTAEVKENADLRAQLAKRDDDTARLDWLDENVHWTMTLGRDVASIAIDFPAPASNRPLRELIDAARVSADASKEDDRG